MSSSRDQLINKNSQLVPTTGGSPTAEVINLQLTGDATHGNTFFLTPYSYRIVSAGGETFDGNFYQIAKGANVSATVSAISASINIASSGYVTVATAAGSTTDLAITAADAGTEIEFGVTGGTVFVATQTTENTAGHVLPEGFESYQTSAGNTVYVRDPAEKTRLYSTYPPKQN